MFFSLLLSTLLTFVELNTENLFDTHHDSLKADFDFLPEGNYHWTRTRYWRKVNALAREIIAMGDRRLLAADSAADSAVDSPADSASPATQPQDWQLPDLVALCEVENDSVMRDLTRRSLLREAGYRYVMTSSPDERGIDVALLYNPMTFRLLHHHAIRIHRAPGMRPTRDLLYVCGQTADSDTLHIFVVHAPSRRGGEKPSRPYRLQVARQLGHAVDSVYSRQPEARIIVAGDFNDYHDSPALDSLYRHRLLSISAHAQGHHGARGTYRYQGFWNSLDHIVCSPALQSRLRHCAIADLPFLLEADTRYGGVKPFRTYRGPVYHGGYSDHLPLVATFLLP